MCDEINLETAKACREMIKEQKRRMDMAYHRIDEIADNVIPDFHFLSHKVSTFWDCAKSPIGMCVWDIREDGYPNYCSCYYCGEPVERK